MRALPNYSKREVALNSFHGHEDVRFKAKVYIEVMSIDGRPVLHIFHDATRLSEAIFIPEISTEDVCEAIIICWPNMYSNLQ